MGKAQQLKRRADSLLAELFRSLVISERQQITALLQGLRTRIDAQLNTGPAASLARATKPPA